MSGSAGREEASRSRRGVYGISVASELSGFGMQALRLYEQYGLVTPARTDGGTRRYSDDDLLQLQRIAELIDAGVNLVGIGRVLDLESRIGELERDIRHLEASNARLREERNSAMRDPFNLASEVDHVEKVRLAEPVAAPTSADDVADRPWDVPEGDLFEPNTSVAFGDDREAIGAGEERRR